MELGGSSLTIHTVSSRDEIWAMGCQEGYYAYSTGATHFRTAQIQWIYSEICGSQNLNLWISADFNEIHSHINLKQGNIVTTPYIFNLLNYISHHTLILENPTKNL